MNLRPQKGARLFTLVCAILGAVCLLAAGSRHYYRVYSPAVGKSFFLTFEEEPSAEELFFAVDELSRRHPLLRHWRVDDQGKERAADMIPIIDPKRTIHIGPPHTRPLNAGVGFLLAGIVAYTALRVFQFTWSFSLHRISELSRAIQGVPPVAEGNDERSRPAITSSDSSA